MLDRYRAQYDALPPLAVAYLWAAAHARHPTLPAPNGHSASGGHLFDAALVAGLFQAEVVMSVADDPSPDATAALEAFVGHPLRAPPPPIKTTEAAGPKPARQQRERTVRDPRVVTSVAPNPRKEGTAAHEGYACWRVGDTVEECIARGLPPRYVRKDVVKGRVVIGDPRP